MTDAKTGSGRELLRAVMRDVRAASAACSCGVGDGKSDGRESWIETGRWKSGNTVEDGVGEGGSEGLRDALRRSNAEGPDCGVGLGGAGEGSGGCGFVELAGGCDGVVLPPRRRAVTMRFRLDILAASGVVSEVVSEVEA